MITYMKAGDWWCRARIAAAVTSMVAEVGMMSVYAGMLPAHMLATGNVCLGPGLTASLGIWRSH